MTRLKIALQFVHQVTAIDTSFAVIPKVMVRVDNRQFWVEGFFLDLRQPSVVGSQLPALHDWCSVTVHVDRRTSDVGPCIGREEAGHICKFFWLPDAAHRYRLAHLVIELFKAFVGTGFYMFLQVLIAFNEPYQKPIDQHVMRRPLARKRLSQCHTSRT